MLTREDFGAFFSAVNEGHVPFTWQWRLLDHVIDDGVWPDAISAPTGTGKSNVVDVHVFANALYAVGAAPRVPRRLSVVVNRRAIVDQHEARAQVIATALMADSRVAVVEQVRAALTQLAPTGEGESPLSVLSLRGGAPSSRAWVDDPRRCLIVCATPDMWGSRLLFRGYGTAPLARPREAGLLALDNVVVVDEAHLSRQLVTTARDVAALSREGAAKVGVPVLQVVGTSATNVVAAGGALVGIAESDVVGPTADPVLTARLVDAKNVRLVRCPEQPNSAAATPAYVKLLASHALKLRESCEADNSGAPRTVGVIVNHVATAAKVADLLEGEHGRRVVTWVGRMRPMDLRRMGDAYPGIFSVKGNDNVEFLVTTQTAEVGVDLDVAALVTELAPATSLAQRFGRVNRLGRRSSAPIDVLVPSASPTKDRPPYAVEDLTGALTWLGRLVESGGDASPWRITGPSGIHPPATQPRRLAWSRVRPSDADVLAATSVPLFQEPDLAFWVRDDLSEEVENVSVVVRDLPADDASAALLISALPPVDDEMLPASVATARSVVTAIIGGGEDERERLFAVGSDGKSVLPHRDPKDLSWVAPGAVVVVDASHRLALQGVLVEADSPRLQRLAPLAQIPEHQVLDGPAASSFLELDVEEQPVRASELLGGPATVVAFDESELSTWVVLASTAASTSDETLRQEWTISSDRVLLTHHGRAVSERAVELGEALGLSPECRKALELAGAWHDAGKADTRFQRYRLGNLEPGEPLAKSHGVQPWKVRRRYAAALPGRWRHEQLSAALCWDAGLDLASAHLVTRLVGTSHGWGRPFFPHGPSSLVDDPAVPNDHRKAAERLFGGVDWHVIREATEAEFGAWGCAYLEALLRSADGTVSKEGR